MTETATLDLTAITADIVSAYVSNNSLRPSDLPELLVQVHGSLASLSAPPAASNNEAERATPAQIRKSITPDALISFVDGKPYKSLKRHLGTHGLTIEEYRARYGLPIDYPAVSANYSAARSALAKELGLGRQRQQAAPAPAPELPSEPAAKPKRARRTRKVAEPA